VIAHAAGLPVEETIVQLAPVAAGAVLAVRLLWQRAMAKARTRRNDPGDER
jgi:hypothetical protein